MKQYQCARFHLYNTPDEHTGGCPVCARHDAELARTRGVWQGAEVAADLAAVLTGDTEFALLATTFLLGSSVFLRLPLGCLDPPSSSSSSSSSSLPAPPPPKRAASSFIRACGFRVVWVVKS